jgi:endonuclease/exonuclease/phosphatase family metal-dependent hydrolase
MRLLSYNIHKGVGGRDRLYRLDRVIHAIRAEKPDLVCLQEVDRHMRRTRHDDQPRVIAEALEAVGSAFQVNVRRKAGGYGNLVLSRWPITTAHQVSLRHRRLWPRGAQLVVVETPEGPLHLVHSHLGLAERERHWQVAHLLDHPHFHEAAALPTIVVGDLNDWRNTLARGPFARHGFHQVTAPRERFRSFPAYFPVVSLDKAFWRGAVAVRHARIVHSMVARRASDHLPLEVDFHLDHSEERTRSES